MNKGQFILRLYMLGFEPYKQKAYVSPREQRHMKVYEATYFFSSPRGLWIAVCPQYRTWRCATKWYGRDKIINIRNWAGTLRAIEKILADSRSKSND